MDLQSTALVTAGVTVLPLADELSVFSAASGQALALNRTAADIFAMCTGTTSLADIAATLAARYDIDLDTAEAAVGTSAHELQHLGLITVTRPNA